jgi:hypothetical protein
MIGTSLTPLEMAVLRDICRQLPPPDQVALETQLNGISVLSRENTGAGFFTFLAANVKTHPVQVDTRGYDVHAEFPGHILRLGFILWLKDGFVDRLEGYTLVPEDTTGLDLDALTFELVSFG